MKQSCKYIEWTVTKEINEEKRNTRIVTKMKGTCCLAYSAFEHVPHMEQCDRYYCSCCLRQYSVTCATPAQSPSMAYYPCLISCPYTLCDISQFKSIQHLSSHVDRFQWEFSKVLSFSEANHINIQNVKHDHFTAYILLHLSSLLLTATVIH